MKHINAQWWELGYTVTRKITRSEEGSTIRRVITRPDGTVVMTNDGEMSALKREQDKAAQNYY